MGFRSQYIIVSVCLFFIFNDMKCELESLTDINTQSGFCLIVISRIVASFCYSISYLLQVYIIDFGLAKKYRDLQTHKHIPYRYLHISLHAFNLCSIILCICFVHPSWWIGNTYYARIVHFNPRVSSLCKVGACRGRKLVEQSWSTSVFVDICSFVIIDFAHGLVGRAKKAFKGFWQPW